MKNYIPTLLFLFSIHAYGGEKIVFQNWALQVESQTTEAFTVNEQQSTMGLFCRENQCSFYLNSNASCQPGVRYYVLMNSSSISTATAMKCTEVGGRYFQALEPFDLVLNAIKPGDTIGFSMAAGPGQFIVTRFSLLGAFEAVSKAISEAAKKSNAEKVVAPETLVNKI